MILTAGASQTPNDATPDPDYQGAGFYRFKIGDFKAIVVSDGSNGFPAWPLWSRNASKEEFDGLLHAHFLPEQSVQVNCNVVLVETSNKRILLDAGVGNGFGPNFGKTPAHLRLAGVEPETIDIVVISHGHNDHFQGLLTPDHKFTFPNARYVWVDSEWDYWNSERAPRDVRAAPLPEAFQSMIIDTARAMLPTLKTRVETVPSGHLIADGVKLVPAHGHTPHHTAVKVTSGSETLIYVGDVYQNFISGLQRPDWSPAFDHQPEAAASTRLRMARELQQSRTRFAAYHFPFPALGHVAGDAQQYCFEPEPWQWASIHR